MARRPARRPLALLPRLVRSLLEGPVTRDYGFTEHPEPEPNYRGMHRVDPSKCIGCSLCAIECPSGAIQMVPLPGAERGGRPRRVPVIRYELCMFCYHCVDICPRGAYVVSNTPPPPTSEPEALVGRPLGEEKG